MKRIQIIIYIFIIIFNILVLPGCWNYKEINDKAIIAGFALDYNKESDETILTVEIVSPINSKNETVIESQIVTSSGINMFDAARNMVARVGKGLFWSHAKICIISQELVKKKDKFIGLIDVLKRDVEIRDTIFLVISKDKTAREILQKSELEIEDVVSYYLDNMLNNEKPISKYYPTTLWRFIDHLASYGISPTLPTVMITGQKESKTASIYGTQVFRSDEIVGWLDGIESRNYLSLIDELGGGVIVIEKDGDRINLEILKNKTKLEPIDVDDELIMKINMKTYVNMSEIDSTKDYISEENRKKLEKIASKKVENQINKLIEKVQKEYKSDIFGFGAIIHREKPNIWKELKGDWEKVFTNLKTEVHVQINIYESSLRSEPIKVED